MSWEETCKVLSVCPYGQGTIEQSEELIGKEKMAQFFVEYYLEKVK